MAEFLAFLFGALCIIEGLYIWHLKDVVDQREGGNRRLTREINEVIRELRVLKSRMRHHD